MDEFSGLFSRDFTDVCCQEGSAKAQVNLDIKVSELEKELNIPMEVHPLRDCPPPTTAPAILIRAAQVWVTSFAEKGTSPKQRKLEAQTKVPWPAPPPQAPRRSSSRRAASHAA